MKLKEIKFRAPRNISEGEMFSFEELFNLDENLETFNKVSEYLVDEKVEKIIDKKEKELIKNYESKKDDLDKELSRYKKEVDENADKKIKSEIKLAEAEQKADLKVAEKEVDMLQKINKEQKQILSDLEKTYSKLMEEKIDRVRKEYSEEKEALIKEYTEKSKASSAIGENAEEEIRLKLRTLYSDDIIEKPNHALGEADVLHTIINKGKDVAQIYYEIKNRKNWSNADYQNFADKVRVGKHEFNIYIAQALPKQSKDQNLTQFDEGLFYDEVNNIYLTSFENWLPVIMVMRRQAIELSLVKNNSKSINDIKDKVYNFFKSPEFTNYFSRLKKNFDEMEKVFKEIQKQAIDGRAIKEKALVEVMNLEAEMDSKLNA